MEALRLRCAGRPLTLRARDYLSSGGEGRVFAQGSWAYKIHHEPSGALSPRRLEELQGLQGLSLALPSALVEDGAGSVLGHRMPRIDQAWPLLRFFSRSFLRDRGLQRPALLGILESLRELLEAIHRRGVQVVDLQPMNVLIRADYQPWLIDVDSFQTPSHRPSFISPEVQDPLAQDWSESSDWFSFAVLAFYLLVGVHPFRGKHPRVSSMQDRMRRGISAFDPAVTLPPMARPPQRIPQPLRGWLRAVLEEGQRSPPPSLGSLSRGPRAAPDLHAVRLALRPGVELTATLRDGLLQLQIPGHRLNPLPLAARQLSCWRGRLFALGHDRLTELRVRLLEGQRALVSQQVLARVHPQAAQLLQGALVQDLLGQTWVTLFPEGGGQRMERVPELDGVQVAEGRWEGDRLILEGLSGGVQRSATLDLVAAVSA